MPLQIVRNDITKMETDAIVNTANPYPGYGPGIDAAVYEAAGEAELLKEREKIGVLDRGTSAITPGYNLPAKYIIHTVGMAWQGGDKGEEEIVRECYRSAFRLAKEKNLESIAFPLLASGCYGFPKGIALRIALSEISDFLKENDMTVWLVVFDGKSFELSGELFGGIDSYISQNYVEKKEEEEYAKPLTAPSSLGNMISTPLRSARKKPGLFAVTGVSGSDFKKCERVAMSAFEVKEESLDDRIKNIGKTFMELVFTYADAKGISDVEIQHRSNMDRKTFSKLKCGNSKNPSKATALALAIGLELNIDDAKDLLARAGYAFSPCSKRDLIVQYFIEADAYDIDAVNLALFEHGEPLLGSVAKE